MGESVTFWNTGVSGLAYLLGYPKLLVVCLCQQLQASMCRSVGVDCVIVKSGRRICGSGAALASAPIAQDKAYFEMKIQCSGMLATTTCHHCRSWTVRHFICFGHNLQFRCD